MENYDIGRLLGKGGFASVHAARDRRNNQRVAIKVASVDARDKIASGKSHMELFQREINVHSSVSTHAHPNIVRLFESFIGPHDIDTTTPKMMVVAMEHCQRGDLQSYFKKIQNYRKKILCTSSLFLQEDSIEHVISQILNGLAFLHKEGVVHRDIKASNILLSPHCASQKSFHTPDSMSSTFSSYSSYRSSFANPASLPFDLIGCTIKIGDFGLAVQMQEDDNWDEAQHTICGTPSCLAPEVVLSTSQTSSLFSSCNTNSVNNINVSFEKGSEYGKRQTDGRGHGQPVDLWSTGCILYAMLVGRYPFNPRLPSPHSTQNDPSPHINTNKSHWKTKETIQNILLGEWNLPTIIASQISPTTHKILKQLLSKNPNKRGSAQQILRANTLWRDSKMGPPSIVTTKNQLYPNIEKEQHSLEAPNLYSNASKNVFLDPIMKHTAYRKKSLMTLDNASNSNLIFDQKYLNCDVPKSHILGAVKRQIRKPISLHPSSEVTTSQQRLKNTTDISDSRMIEKNEMNQFDAKVTITSAQAKTYSDQMKHIKCEGSIERLEGLNRLSSMKHQWKEVMKNKKTSNQYNNGDQSFQKEIHYTVFILANKGVVVQREDADRKGHWLHVTGDGLQVCTGRLSHHLCSSNQLYKLDHREKLSDPNEMEAFLRAPIELKNSFQKSSSLSNETGQNQLLFRNKLFSPKSGHVCLLYKPLSILLKRHNKGFRAMYQSLTGIIASIKKCTPKITLYIHSPINTLVFPVDAPCYTVGKDVESKGGLFAKTMLMENTPLPDVLTSFVDGITIRHSLSIGRAELVFPKSACRSSIDIEPGILSKIGTKISLKPNWISQELLLYTKHLDIAQNAMKECLHIEDSFCKRQFCQKQDFFQLWRNMVEEESNYRDVFPVTKAMIASGPDRTYWVDIDTTAKNAMVKEEVLPDAKKQDFCRKMKPRIKPLEESVTIDKILLDDDSIAESIESIDSKEKNFEQSLGVNTESLSPFRDLPFLEKQSTKCELPDVGVAVRLKCGDLYAKLKEEKDTILMLDSKGEKIFSWELWRRNKINVLEDYPDSVYHLSGPDAIGLTSNISQKKIKKLTTLLRFMASA